MLDICTLLVRFCSKGNDWRESLADTFNVDDFIVFEEVSFSVEFGRAVV